MTEADPLPTYVHVKLVATITSGLTIAQNQSTTKANIATDKQAVFPTTVTFATQIRSINFGNLTTNSSFRLLVCLCPIGRVDCFRIDAFFIS
jgi:hypothetical protein